MKVYLYNLFLLMKIVKSSNKCDYMINDCNFPFNTI